MTAQTTTHPISATSRTVVGKQVRQLRNQDLVPAVVYGHGQASANITLNAREFSKLYAEAGSSTLLDLTIDGSKSHKVLVHDVQTNPRNRQIIHVDLYQVNMKEKLQTEIPLEFVGEAPAVTDLDGTLITVKSEVNVECLPQDLVQHIEVDISSLATFEDVIRMSDIKVPAGIVILDDQEEVVLSVAEPRSEAEMAELDEPVGDTPEVPAETGSGTDAEDTDAEAEKADE